MRVITGLECHLPLAEIWYPPLAWCLVSSRSTDPGLGPALTAECADATAWAGGTVTDLRNVAGRPPQICRLRRAGVGRPVGRHDDGGGGAATAALAPTRPGAGRALPLNEKARAARVHPHRGTCRADAVRVGDLLVVPALAARHPSPVTMAARRAGECRSLSTMSMPVPRGTSAAEKSGRPWPATHLLTTERAASSAVTVLAQIRD